MSTEEIGQLEAVGGDRIRSELTDSDALRLLGDAPVGRVVFTNRALPAIRVVNHLVDRGDIIIRTSLGTQFGGLVGSGRGVVVAYEADAIDVTRRTGWFVAVTGLARTVTDPELVSRYEGALRPWIDGPMDCVIRIRPEIVTGFRLTDPRSVAG
ncbi:MAG TPA: pyridoxamine 5'-phosphate oxidase family protein [Micromonosporaceae bacterium]